MGQTAKNQTNNEQSENGLGVVLLQKTRHLSPVHQRSNRSENNKEANKTKKQQESGWAYGRRADIDVGAATIKQLQKQKPKPEQIWAGFTTEEQALHTKINRWVFHHGTGKSKSPVSEHVSPISWRNMKKHHGLPVLYQVCMGHGII